MTTLTFAALRAANLARQKRYFPAGAAPWTLSDWACALAGEAGEACNIVKKLNRERDGVAGNGVETVAGLKASLAGELADTVIYLDLLAAAAGEPLGEDFGSFVELRRARRADRTRLRRELLSVAACRVMTGIGDLAMRSAPRGGPADLHAEMMRIGLWVTLVDIDILAHRAGIDLGAAVIAKFDEVSKRNGFPERLGEGA